MKALNTMKFVSNTIEQLTIYKDKVEKAETFEEAKKEALVMMGFLNGAVIFLNTMICKENNDFTGEFGEVIDGWFHKMYQALVNKATDTT